MTMAHTPGPWHCGQGNGEGSIFAESGRMQMEATGTTLYPICTIASGWKGDEDAANARLIAAAPELLERLETLALVLDGIHQSMGAHRCTIDCPDIAKHVDAARKILAKAKE